MRRSPQWARWTKFSKVGGGTTIVFSGLGGVASQLYADRGKDLTTEQRVVRTTAGAANDAALSWGGAASGAWAGSRAGGAAGAAVGSVFPVVGTGVGAAVGTAGGAIVGGIVGSGAGSWVADHTREAAADFAQGAGDRADDVWDSTAGARETIGDGLDKINPF
jgi:phage tail tape-measure protein